MSILGVYFMNPKWLVAAALFPAFWLALNLFQRAKEKRFELFSKRSLWGVLAPEYDPGAAYRKNRRWAIAWAFLALAAARPQWGSHEETLKTNGLDVLLVIDVSRSMDTEDVMPSRLKKMKHFVKTLAERLAGDRLGVVAFAGSAHLLSPLTTDLDYVNEIVSGLTPNSVSNQGTDIGAALDTAIRALDRGSEQLGGASKGMPNTRSIVLISDGEDNEGEVAAAEKLMKGSDIQLYVFGIGTEKGGPIPVRDDSGQNVGYKRDRGGQTIISRFNPKMLSSIAEKVGGKFWSVTPSEQEIDELVQSLGSQARTEFQEKRVVIRQERFAIPLAIGVLMLFAELGTALRRRSDGGRRRFGERVGAATTAMLALFAWSGFLAIPRLAHATDSLQGYLENERGLKDFESKKFDDARSRFSDAQVNDPRSPEFPFNQGAVHLAEQNWQRADEAYEEAAKVGAAQGRFRESAASRFNQGVARTQAKDKAGAARAYIDALENLRKEPDPELEFRVRKNLELLFAQGSGKGDSKDQDQDQKQGQQDQDQKKDQSDQSKSGKNSNDGQDQDKKDPKDKDDSKDKDKQKEKQKEYDSPKKNFKSEKLNRDDAERVLSELSRREDDVKERLKRLKGRPQNLEKDW